LRRPSSLTFCPFCSVRWGGRLCGAGLKEAKKAYLADMWT